MHTSPAMERLLRALKHLPGIGDKSAARLAYFMLGAPDPMLAELSEAIGRIKTDTALCESCFNLGDRTPCNICSDHRRDRSLICVVEEPADLAAIEKSGSFAGLYHVLGGTLSPIDGMGPESLRIGELESRLTSGEVAELILATNPNAEGDATAHFIADRLKGSSVKLTRIAYGMPLGGDLEYADYVTLGRSLENRSTMR
jgi:recombination protein RecR